MSESKFPFTCPKCSQRFSITAPTPNVMNSLQVSVAAASHEKPILCIKCGQEYQFIVSNAQFNWSVVPLTEEQAELLRGGKIITPSLTIN